MRSSGSWLTRAAGVLLAVALCAATGVDTTSVTPAPQPPLAVYGSDDLQPIRDAFNLAADRPRVLAMLSPT